MVWSLVPDGPLKRMVRGKLNSKTSSLDGLHLLDENFRELGHFVPIVTDFQFGMGARDKAIDSKNLVVGAAGQLLDDTAQVFRHDVAVLIPFEVGS